MAFEHPFRTWRRPTTSSAAMWAPTRVNRRACSTLGLSSLEELIDRAVPESIRTHDGRWRGAKPTPSPASAILRRNDVFTSLIGMGYRTRHAAGHPPQRLGGPRGTRRTPRTSPRSRRDGLEALLNFQTMVIDLTGMEIANAPARRGDRRCE